METEIVETIERVRWKHIYQFINGVQTIQEIPKLKCNGFKVRYGRYKEKIVLYRFQYGKEIVETTTT